MLSRTLESSHIASKSGLRHPRGHVAWTQDWAGRRYRIDFNLQTDPDGRDAILVVTAMQITP